ncbi:MAG: hypothetical protein ABIA78_04240 [archaeon]
MKKQNILFICKYNRFRSKVAETYFKKVNKNSKIKTKTAGIIEVNKPLDINERKRNVYLKKTFGFVLRAKSVSVSVRSLLWADRIIIVADDVPKILFNSKKWKNKVEVWKVPDEDADNERNINRIVKSIKIEINKLVKELK